MKPLGWSIGWRSAWIIGGCIVLYSATLLASHHSTMQAEQKHRLRNARSELRSTERSLSQALREGRIGLEDEIQSSLVIATAQDMLLSAERRAPREDITDILDTIEALMAAIALQPSAAHASTIHEEDHR